MRASATKDDIIAALVKRVDAGGMVLVDSDLYPVNPLNTELADIVLLAIFSITSNSNGWSRNTTCRSFPFRSRPRTRPPVA